MPVPFLDMRRMHEPLLEEFEQSFRELVLRSAFINGPEVQQFEKDFAAWTTTSHCIGVASGLDALKIGLRALGLKAQEKVIVPAMTFIATIEAVTEVGGIPVLVDIDKNGLMDPEQVEAQLKTGARFIIPVHLYGLMLDPEILKFWKNKYGAIILEDACQAHGASYKGEQAGAIGQASAFSFYPGKNLGALGDAGALCTSDSKVDNIARALREHGQTEKYYHTYQGYTARLDNIQAKFLTIKLKQLTHWNQTRIQAAQKLYNGLQGIGDLQFQSNDFSGRHVYHLFVVLTKTRKHLSEVLKSKGIGFGYHYPIAIHQLECYRHTNFSKQSFPMAEAYANQTISLPLFPGITDNEITQIIEGVKAAYE